MTWSNQIPNPFTVGGGGISGRIVIYNEDFVIIGTIDEDGVFVYAEGDDGSYVQMSPDVPIEGTEVAGLGVYPKFGNFWTIEEPGIVFAEMSLTGMPITTIAAPSQTGGGHTFVRMWSPNESGAAGLIELLAQNPLTGNNRPEVNVDPKLTIKDNTVGTEIDAYGPIFSTPDTETSATFQTKAGSGLSNQFVKMHDSTALKITYTQSWSTTAVNTTARFGVRLNDGTTTQDFEIGGLHINTASIHLPTFCLKVIPAIFVPAASYSVDIVWRRSLGAGTLTVDTNDYESFCIEEVSDT